MDTFMQPEYYSKLQDWIKSVFAKSTRNQREDETEEVLNQQHILLTGEGEEIEELVEGSL